MDGTWRLDQKVSYDWHFAIIRVTSDSIFELSIPPKDSSNCEASKARNASLYSLDSISIKHR